MGRPPAILWALLATIVAVEAVLQAADLGLIGTSRWRSLAYQYGAFWPGLLDDWRPNYPGQPALMFLTYAFLHGGIGHLLGNAITLLSLGSAVARRFGTAGLLEITAAAALGGALLFGLLSRTPQPMVGASGALFGLAGALTLALWQDRDRAPHALRAVWAIVIGLAALNLVMFVALDGFLAWQTHLGGFAAGAALAAALPRRDGSRPD